MTRSSGHIDSKRRRPGAFLSAANRLRDGGLTAALTASNLLRVASVLALTVILGRVIGPDAVGRFSVLLAAVAVLQAISIGGLSGAAIHRLIVAKDGLAHSIAVIIAARALLIPPFYIVGAVAFVVIDGDTPQMSLAISVLFFGYAVGTFDIAEIIRTSRSEFYQISLRRIALVIVFLPLKVLAAWIGSIELVVISQGVEAALWQAVLLPCVGLDRKVLKRSFFNLAQGFREVLELKFLWMSSIAAVLASRADIFVVAGLLGGFLVGQYSTASRMVEAATIAAAALATVLLSKISVSSNSAVGYALSSKSATRKMLALGLSATILMATAGPEIVRTLYGPQFEIAANIMTVYSIVLIPIFSRQLISKFLIVEKAYGYSFVSNLLGLIINIALNLALLPVIGIWGAVYAALASYFLAIVFSFCPTARGRRILTVSVTSAFVSVRRTERACAKLIDERRLVDAIDK